MGLRRKGQRKVCDKHMEMAWLAAHPVASVQIVVARRI